MFLIHNFQPYVSDIRMTYHKLNSIIIVICLFIATTQLSKIKSTSAKADEFDMLAQSRSDGKTKEMEVDLLQSQNTKPTDFDEIEEWLKAEKTNEAEESLTSKEFEKFLAERAAVADGLPTISTSKDDGKSKKKAEEPLLG
jgi:hypothetical protein